MLYYSLFEGLRLGRLRLCLLANIFCTSYAVINLDSRTDPVGIPNPDLTELSDAGLTNLEKMENTSLFKRENCN